LATRAERSRIYLVVSIAVALTRAALVDGRLLVMEADLLELHSLMPAIQWLLFALLLSSEEMRIGWSTLLRGSL
jgi:hypothetical protein